MNLRDSETIKVLMTVVGCIAGYGRGMLINSLLAISVLIFFFFVLMRGLFSSGFSSTVFIFFIIVGVGGLAILIYSVYLYGRKGWGVYDPARAERPWNQSDLQKIIIWFIIGLVFFVFTGWGWMELPWTRMWGQSQKSSYQSVSRQLYQSLEDRIRETFMASPDGHVQVMSVNNLLIYEVDKKNGQKDGWEIFYVNNYRKEKTKEFLWKDGSVVLERYYNIQGFLDKEIDLKTQITREYDYRGILTRERDALRNTFKRWGYADNGNPYDEAFVDLRTQRGYEKHFNSKGEENVLVATEGGKRFMIAQNMNGRSEDFFRSEFDNEGQVKVFDRSDRLLRECHLESLFCRDFDGDGSVSEYNLRQQRKSALPISGIENIDLKERRPGMVKREYSSAGDRYQSILSSASRLENTATPSEPIVERSLQSFQTDAVISERYSDVKKKLSDPAAVCREMTFPSPVLSNMINANTSSSCSQKVTNELTETLCVERKYSSDGFIQEAYETRNGKKDGVMIECEKGELKSQSVYADDMLQQ